MQHTGIFYAQRDVTSRLPSDYLEMVTRDIDYELGKMAIEAVRDGRQYVVIYEKAYKKPYIGTFYEDMYSFVGSVTIKLLSWHDAKISEYVSDIPDAQSEEIIFYPSLPDSITYKAMLTRKIGGWYFSMDEIGWKRVI